MLTSQGKLFDFPLIPASGSIFPVVSAKVGSGRGGTWEGWEGWEWRDMGGVSQWEGGDSVGQRIQSVSHGPWGNLASYSGVEDTSDHEQIAPASMLTTVTAVSWRLLKLSDVSNHFILCCPLLLLPSILISPPNEKICKSVLHLYGFRDDRNN